MQILIDISKDRYDEIMSMDWKNGRRFFDEELRAIHDGKALEQEPCEDCISRQAVLDLPRIKTHNVWGNVIYESVEVENVRQLPSVTPQQKWIPVSERLPEDNTLVLVTVKVGNREPKVRSGYYYMNGHFHIDNGDSWEARDKELIAWMPLPEPFKKSEIPTGAEGSDKE